MGNGDEFNSIQFNSIQFMVVIDKEQLRKEEEEETMERFV